MLTLRTPGDKSISHRALMLAALAKGESRLRGLPDSADVRSTERALRALGVDLPPSGSDLRLRGGGAFTGGARLDCRNSGTTARLLAGMTAGLGVGVTLDGDASLRRRPMDRVVYPLQAMGARISYEEERGRLPIRLSPRATGALRSLRHRPRVASAQVKSALLLAAVTARVDVDVREPGRSRDHTERMLAAMGAPIEFGPEGEGARARLAGEGWEGALRPLDLRIPGDPSSAAFLAVAALLAGRPLHLEEVGLNPTRTGFLEVLREMGADLEARTTGDAGGEPVGEILVRPSELTGFRLGPARLPRTLDEVPALAVLAARARGTSVLEGAAELRVKESDRLALLARGLARLGVRCREREEGLEIEGTDRPLEGVVETGGDHRIAMAFGSLGAAPGCRVRVDDPDCAAVSFPGFWEALGRVAGAPAGVEAEPPAGGR